MIKKLLFVFLAVSMLLMPLDLALAYQQDEPILSKEFVDKEGLLGDESTTISIIRDPSEYIPEDKDWPIIQTERYAYVDKETGLLH